MTIGNLPKELRRKPSRHAYVLLGYLPIPTLKGVGATVRRRMKANLFHTCMRRVLQPFYHSGKAGVKMRSGDGKWRRCYPIFAAFAGDYPEQVLVACVKRGECPACTVHWDDVGENEGPFEHRNLTTILTALETLPNGPVAFTQACNAAGIKPVQKPFWVGLPYTDIYYSITPDILHQLYQGIIKHLVSWLRKAVGDAEINARVSRLPPNHQMRYFSKGITHLSRVTGREHSQVASTLLALVIGVRLPNNLSPVRLVRAVRAILDFTFLAQYPAHSTETLRELKDARHQFHENKEIFRQLGIRTNFRIPKLHALEHYDESIQLFGTTDNYNTENTERLHIDFAKNAYRSTNFKDEFPQMTVWLERQEKVFEHRTLIEWRLAGRPVSGTISRPTTIGVVSSWTLRLTKHPSVKNVPDDQLVRVYGATQLRSCLAEYIAWRQNPTASWREVHRHAQQISIPALDFHVYHFIKFTKIELYSDIPQVVADSVHAKPPRVNNHGITIPARFDTVLIDIGTTVEEGISGTYYHQP